MIIYAVFVLCLCFYVYYSISFPALAVGLGIATFGLEQIAMIILPQFQVHRSLFNIIFGCFLCVSFTYNLLKGKIGRFQTNRIKNIYMVLLLFILLFWISSLWSPFKDYKNSISYLPYYAIYLFILPLLVSDPGQMIKAFSLLGIILLIGFLGLLMSGDLSILISSQIGRSQISLSQTDNNVFSNPLALADTGVLLGMISLLIFIVARKKIIKALFPGYRSIVMLVGLFGASLGLWVAFLSSKAETLFGLLMIVLFIILASAKNVRRALLYSTIAILIVIISATIIYFSFYEKIIEYSPTFSKDDFIISWKVRIELITNALQLYTSKELAVLIGIGARGYEHVFGTWPHNASFQALCETGVIGLILYAAGIIMTIRFGLLIYKKARKEKNINAQIWTAFIICMLFYNIIMYHKKGTLAEHNMCMWIAFSAVAFDRVRKTLN